MRYLLASACLLLSPVAVTAQTQATAQHPVESFAELPFMEGPKLSPTGNKVAARVAIKGEQRLMIVDVDDFAKSVFIPVGENDLNWWRWVNDEWLVIGIGNTTLVEGQDWYIRRAVGVHADGSALKPLAFREAAQGADDVLWVAEDGSPRILLSLQKSIYTNDPEFWAQVFEVDVSTGKMKRVVGAYQGILDWYADASGTVRMGVGYDDASQSTKLLYRDGSKQGFKTVDRAQLKKGERLTVPALFLAEPGKALAYSDKDGFEALYELDLASLELGDKVFGKDGYDLDGLLTNRAGTALSGVTYTDVRSTVHWLDPQMSSLQTSLNLAAGPGRHPRLVSMNRDRSKMIVAVGGADSPESYFLVDPATGAASLFAHTSNAFKSDAFAPVRTIRYSARDGLEIPAILTLPKGREAKNLPLIVMPHGGPAARDSEGWDWWTQFLADRGYAVIQPNYRGSTGFGTAFQEKGDGEWGLKMQDDLDDAVAYLVEEGIADPKRVCMVGASYGGYAALRAAQRDGDRYRCAVSYAGVADLAHLARFDQRSLYGKSYKANLKEKAPDFKAVSPIHYPEQFSAPVLLVHGKKDLRVPVKQSREMAEKLTKAGKAVEYVEQPLGDHHFSRQEDRLQFLKLLEAFLTKHNPA